MGKKKGGKSKGYNSQGIVGTTKTGWTAKSILQSMLALGRKQNRDYGQKQAPQKGNEHKAEQRRLKKKTLRMAKKTASTEV